MTDLIIHDDNVAQRLREIAGQEHRPIEQVLDDLLHLYDARHTLVEDPILQMAAAADRLGLVADRDDISEHFDSVFQ